MKKICNICCTAALIMVTISACGKETAISTEKVATVKSQCTIDMSSESVEETGTEAVTENEVSINSTEVTGEEKTTTESKETTETSESSKTVTTETAAMPTTPTAEPTLEPTSELTPKPTAEPMPEATPEPIPKPTPEPIPEATPEPTPEATPEPTPEATPEPTPEPMPEPIPESCSHNFIDSEIVVDSTCKEPGRVRQVCTKCGVTNLTILPSNDNHSYEIVNNPDCGTNAHYECSVCHSRYQGETGDHSDADNDGECDICFETLKAPEPTLEPTPEPMPAACEHSYIDGEVVEPSTCKEPGLIVQTCSKCGSTNLSMLPSNDNHSYEIVNNPDCGTNAHYECSVCHNWYQGELGDHADADGDGECDICFEELK